MNLSKAINYYTGAFVLFVYTCLSVIFTWPLLLNLKTSLFGDFGDTRGGIWWTWADIHGLRSAPVCDLLSAPFGMNMGFSPSQPVFESLLIFPGKLIGEIAAYNLYVLLSFPLTAFVTYLFLNAILHNKLASFTGGLIFGFNPGAVMQAVGGHASFAFNMFIPLLLLALFANRSKRSILSAFFVGLSYAFVTLNSLYFGYFSLFIAILFIAFDCLTLEDVCKKRVLINYFFAAFFAFILIIPFQYKMILRYFSPTNTGGIKVGLVREFGDLITYSARPLEYFLPSIDHPVLGSFLRSFFQNNLHGSNLFEQTLYLGFIPLILCIVGFYMLPDKHGQPKRQLYFLFFSTGALLMVLLSMPPFISFGNIKLPAVSYFMYKIAPMFRVYARFGILANFFMACASAVVLAELSQRVSKKRYYLLLSILLPLLIFEYWSIPPHAAHAVDTPPVVYQWLAQEPGDIIIAEYPMMKSGEASFYTYLFWQRIHKKRMVNGASPSNRKAWEFYERVHDLADPETPQLLKSVGVKYIIVHKEMYREGEIPAPLKRYYSPDVAARQYNDGVAPVNPFLKTPHMVFGDDIVYSLDKR